MAKLPGFLNHEFEVTEETQILAYHRLEVYNARVFSTVPFGTCNKISLLSRTFLQPKTLYLRTKSTKCRRKENEEFVKEQWFSVNRVQATSF